MKPILIALMLLPVVAAGQVKAVSVNLYDNQENLMDGIAVFFNGQSDTVDLFDIKKINNPSVNIGIIAGNDTLAGEQRTSYASVQLRLWNLIAGSSYRLQIITKGVTNAFLADSSHYNAVGDSLSYKFSVSKTATNRLKLEFCSVLSLPVTGQVTAPYRTINYLNTGIYYVYNIMGQLIYRGSDKPYGLFKNIGGGRYIKY